MRLLSDETREAEFVGKIVPTAFEISDAGMMIEHMVTTIYKNKKRVIIQEIASNARDAHREVGKQQVPIIIKIPNRFSNTLEIRDFGPGLTPDRIQKVFTKVGASTKRDDNTQTGGFGIGAKTPWAYTDVFNIRTIANEAGKLVCRTYAAIHGDKTFTLMEMGDAVVIDPTDPNVDEADKITGTTIVIAVENKDDYRYFADYAVQVTQWWDVRPTITGMDPAPQYQVHKPLYQGANWQILTVDRYNRSHTLCIDGIPYPLDINALEDCPDHLSNLTGCGLVLFFGVGELAVSLNREELQYIPKTRNAIIARLEEIYKELQVKIEAEIGKADSFQNATIAFRKMIQSLNHRIVNACMWNGIEVNGDDISCNKCDVRIYTKQVTVGGLKLKSRKTYSMRLAENNLIVHNDCDTQSPLKIWQLFDTNPTVEAITVVTFLWDLTKPNGASDKAKWIKDSNWDVLNAVSFSTVPKKKMSKATMPNGAKIPRGIAKGFIHNGGSYRNAWTPEELIDLKNGSGVYVTVSHDYAKDFSQQKINKARGLLGNIEVYGIHERFIDKLGAGWKTLAQAVKDEMANELKSIDTADHATYQKYSGRLMRDYNRGVNDIMEVLITENLLTDPTNCILVDWYNMAAELQVIKDKADLSIIKIQRFKELYNVIDLYYNDDTFLANAQVIPKWDGLMDRCLKEYPLIGLIKLSYYNDTKQFAHEFGFYVNTRQKENVLTLTEVSV